MPRTELALLLALAMAGCSSGKSAEEKQLDELRDELSKVQQTSDAFEERLDKLEVDSADDHKGDSTPPAEASHLPPARTLSAPVATPPLRLVRLGPESEPETASSETAGSVDGADPNDTTPRPVIKIEGQGGEVSITDEKGHRVRKGNGHVDRIEETLPPESPNGGASGPSIDAHAGSRPSAFDPNAKRAYDDALALVNAKHYGEALEALAGFLVRWPDHPNADNAMYWRGECYLAQGDAARAAEQFEGVLARFPLGNKVPDALYKLGVARQRLGDSKAASAAFERLRRDYPHSDAARHLEEKP